MSATEAVANLANRGRRPEIQRLPLLARAIHASMETIQISCFHGKGGAQACGPGSARFAFSSVP
jgi:hypothetical protein